MTVKDSSNLGATGKFMTEVAKTSEKDREEAIRKFITGMSLDEKIAQMSVENNSTPSNPREMSKEDYIHVLENAYGINGE